MESIPPTYTKIFFYDAVPKIEVGEAHEEYEKRIASKVEDLERIGVTSGVHVFEGEAVRRKKRGLEQKMVDVKMAVDLLTCSYRRLVPKVTVLTGDVDLLPAFEAMQADGMYVTLWYPPDGTSSELKRSADVRVPLLLDDIRALLDRPSAKLFDLPATKITDNFRELGLPFRKWREPGIGQARLYKRGSEWTVGIPRQDAISTLKLYTSKNLELLRQYLAEYGLTVPHFDET